MSGYGGCKINKESIVFINMKKITIKKVKLLLDSNKCDEPTSELILNNISMYNSIIDEIKDEQFHNRYLAYQLNLAIVKQINDVKKANGNDNDDKDGFTSFKNKHKKSNN